LNQDEEDEGENVEEEQEENRVKGLQQQLSSFMSKNN
jgi:hypothetical protein